MLSIKNLTKRTEPQIPYHKIVDTTLGKDYDLSVVFVADALSKRLNKKYRNKNRPTNILSFPIDKCTGEIFLNLGLIKKEAKLSNLTFRSYTAYILIHGLLHLKGFVHGSKMKSEEQKVLDRFDLIDK